MSSKDNLARGVSTLFKPGQSGNPAGRPKSTHDLKRLAKQKTKEAFEKIVKLMESDDERVAFMACKEVLDRAWGKAAVAEDADADQRNVTINIVRYGEPEPTTIDTHSVRMISFAEDTQPN